MSVLKKILWPFRVFVIVLCLPFVALFFFAAGGDVIFEDM